MSYLLEKSFAIVTVGLAIAVYGLLVADSDGGNTREMIINGGALIMSFGLVFAIAEHNERYPLIAVVAISAMIGLSVVFYRASVDGSSAYVYGALGQLAAIILGVAVARGAIAFKR